MARLTHNDLIVLLLAISTMLIMSRMVGELGKKIGLPMVMGELLVGIGLGPTVLGACFPAAYAYLFPFTASAGFSLALDGILSLSVIMLLFVAGLELQLSQVVRHGKVAIYQGRDHAVGIDREIIGLLQVSGKKIQRMHVDGQF